MPVNENTVPVPSPDEAFVDRYRRITSRWYPFVKRLFESLRTTANAVDAVQVDVDQINSSYTISVNANGRTTGAIKLDGSGALSTFSVLADKFIVVHPSADSTTIQAFIIGVVNGVSTVGINGNLIVDGSIVARHLDVDTLDAVSSNMGTITVGRIQSADGNFLVDATNKRIRIVSV